MPNYSDSYGSSFDEYCIWLDDVIHDMFDSLPWTLPDMPHTPEEMAALSYGQAHAEHFSGRTGDPNADHYHYDEKLHQTVAVYGPSRARLRQQRRRG